MCYSALVKQEVKELRLAFHVRMDEQLIFDFFKKRLDGDDIIISKAFERNFEENDPINELIESYAKLKFDKLEAQLFKQKARQNEAILSLQAKLTKGAQKEFDVSGRQIERIIARIARLKETELRKDETRIFPFEYAPVMILKDGVRTIVPMRFHLRQPDKGPSFDFTNDGCYNARRDALTKFWSKQFGQRHGILVITDFFEYVLKHHYEKRELENGEDEKSIVLKFTPTGFSNMIIPVVWDTWTDGQTSFDSFALITDEPPPEVLETGHDRCPIFLKETRIDDWLSPEGKSQNELFEILDDRSKPFYSHELAG